MAAVSLSQADAQRVAERHRGCLDVAALNGPRSAVLSGTRSALEAAVAELRAQGIEVRDLQIDYAFHSAQMTDLAQEFARDLGEISRNAAATPVFSTLTGGTLAGDEVDASLSRPCDPLARAFRGCDRRDGRGRRRCISSRSGLIRCLRPRSRRRWRTIRRGPSSPRFAAGATKARRCGLRLLRYIPPAPIPTGRPCSPGSVG